MVMPILQLVKRHDQYRLEVKVDYALLKGEETRYKALSASNCFWSHEGR